MHRSNMWDMYERDYLPEDAQGWDGEEDKLKEEHDNQAEDLESL